MKSEQEIIAKILNLRVQLITNSTDANRPLCSDECDWQESWADALQWVLDETREPMEITRGTSRLSMMVFLYLIEKGYRR